MKKKTIHYTKDAKIAHAEIKRQGYTERAGNCPLFSGSPPGLDIVPGYALLVAYMVKWTGARTGNVRAIVLLK